MRRNLKIAVLGLGVMLASIGWGAGLLGGGVAGGRDAVDHPEATGKGGGVKAKRVTLSPVGEVRFDRVPRRVVTLDANYNDMLVALGGEDKLIATGSASNFYDGFYKQLPQLDLGYDKVKAGLTFLYGSGRFDKEALYELDADVHHMDPYRLMRRPGWTQGDIDEIADNVGPFFANRYSRTHDFPGNAPYAYYTLWQLSAKVGQVYRRAERIAALKSVYERMIDRIKAKLPPKAQRPKVALVIVNQGRFMPFSFEGKGFGTAQYRAVGARDAFAPIAEQTYADAGRGTMIDLEAMLKLDPDVLIVPFAIYREFQTRVEAINALKDDPLGRQLSAIRHHRVYPGGSPLQGPIFNLFQVEMAAKQIYPKLFGQTREDHDYPRAEQLFDRDRVAAILRPAPEP